MDGEQELMGSEESQDFPYSDGMELIKQGAEAKLYKATYLGKPSIVKERFSKKYRHPELDVQLTKDRLKSEVRCLARCRQHGISVPTLYLVDPEKNWIIMEFVEDSTTVRDHISSVYAETGGGEIFEEKLLPLAQEIGRIIATMHKNNIIHGDLTTSNMLLKTGATAAGDSVPHVLMIDFGLSYNHQLAEDKGVDLYVLEKALLSTHPNSEKVFEMILDKYWEVYGKGADAVRKKLDEVRLRGRKRLMVG